MLYVDILTLYPTFFDGPLAVAGIGRAIAREGLSIAIHNVRDFSLSKHHSVDDYPYGGGAGMVMQAPPLFAATRSLALPEATPIILLTPQGRLFTQDYAQDLARQQRFVLICGQFEGIDERVHRHLATEELSVGDYVLSGGEAAALIVVDAVARLLPGVIDEASTQEESHSHGLLEYPQYTRPPVFEGQDVPDVLLSGHHAAVAAWRRTQSLRRTFERRPDLLAHARAKGLLSAAEQIQIQRWRDEQSEQSAAD